jgi:hypothetical protein
MWRYSDGSARGSSSNLESFPAVVHGVEAGLAPSILVLMSMSVTYLLFFFFFFLTCLHKRGEGGFELITFAL